MNITISDIVNVYYCETDCWSRDFFAPRKHDGIVLFTQGEIEYRFAEKTLVAKEGDLLFLPGNVPYSGRKLCKTVGFFVIDFDCVTPDEFNRLIHPTVVPAQNYSAAKAKFSKAADVWIKQRMDSQLRMKEIVYALLCNAVCPDTKEKSLTQTDSIIDYICENICDPSLSVKFLCEKFYISESQLRRNFLNQTGMKPNEYITNIRLNLAKNELAYTSKSIMTVSEFCGFSSPYYFSNCFSRHTGMSPSQFRKHISCKL